MTRISRALVLGLIFLTGSVLAAEVSSSAAGWQIKPRDWGQPELTTTLHLLMNPKAFDRKLVQVSGILSVEFEDERLYLSREFYEAVATEYAILLELPPGAAAASKKLQGHRVIVKGVFHIPSSGPRAGLFQVKLLQRAETLRSEAK